MSLLDKIKLLIGLRSPLTDLVGEAKEAKTGWKTAHFWVTVLATLGTIATAVSGYIPATVAIAVVTGLTVVYNIARAIENAQMEGVQPFLTTTRFWAGILGIVSAGLISLKTGGVDPKWVESAIAGIAAIMALAQSVGANKPS